MKWIAGVTIAAAMVVASGCIARAATYYVDYDGGADASAGLSPEAAFKHAPGDPAATVAAKSAALLPGDRILFKGGVIYRGTVVVKASGAAGQPITFDGNTAGTFGNGRAIIDGADDISAWHRCASAQEAGGNPRWADIFYADVPAVANWRRANLCDGNRPFPVAQEPKPAEPIFQEGIGTYYVMKGQLEKAQVQGQPPQMTLTDPNVLTAKSPDYYKGMTLGIHAGANALIYLPVKGYAPEAHRLALESYDGKQYAETRYSLFNSVKLIAKPDEFSVEPTGDPNVSRIFFLPGTLEGAQPAGVGFSRRAKGFDLEKASHIIVQGFIVRRQSNGSEVFGILAEGPASDITIKDCEVTLVRGGAGIYISHVNDVLVQHCFVHDNPGHASGMVLHTVARGRVRDCTLQRNTSTGLDYYYCTDGQVVGNTVLDHRGMHANGLTFYLECRNILIERNYVARGQSALTMQDSDDLTIRNNVLDSNARATTLSLWSSSHLKNVHIVYNCILRSDPGADWAAALFSNSKALEGLVVRNNIIDGLSSSGLFARAGTFSNNLYTRKGADQQNGLLGTAELYDPDLRKIFVDVDAGDFHLRKDGPASGKGMTQEGDGTNRPAGEAVDLGPFEAPPAEKR